VTRAAAFNLFLRQDATTSEGLPPAARHNAWANLLGRLDGQRTDVLGLAANIPQTIVDPTRGR